MLGKEIVRRGESDTSARKKACTYMRWLVREYPDLRIVDTFFPKDLYLPLDKNVGRVMVPLGVLNSLGNFTWRDVETITEFARRLYPEDPVKVDYPFFLLGRKIREIKLPMNIENLNNVIMDYFSSRND